MRTFKSEDLSSAHQEVIEAMKDQLLIVLINRLGGQIEIPVKEIDATDGLGLSMRLDHAKRSFYFEVLGKERKTDA